MRYNRYVFVFVFLIGCENNSHKEFPFLENLNEKRKQYHLYPIDNSFVIKFQNDSQLTCHPNYKGAEGVHLMHKEITFRKNEILSEIDIYDIRTKNKKDRLMVNVDFIDSSKSNVVFLRSKYIKKYDRDDFFELEIDTFPTFEKGVDYLKNIQNNTHM